MTKFEFEEEKYQMKKKTKLKEKISPFLLHLKSQQNIKGHSSFFGI